MITWISASLQVFAAIAALALLLFIPGYLTLAAFGLTKKTKRRPDGKRGEVGRGDVEAEGERGGNDLADVIIFSLLVSALLSSWWGITLAELSALTLPNQLAGVGAFSLAMAWIAARRRRLAPKFPSPAKEDLALLGIIAVAAVLFWPPGQPVFGTHDAGLHFGSGVNLGKTGSFLIHDPTLMSALQDPNLFRLPLGLMSADGQQGLFVAQFSGLFEVWIALFFLIFGWWSPSETFPALAEIGRVRHPITVPLVFYVTPLFGLLGAASVYSCARAIYSRRVGLLAALFLTVSLPQVWYSRLTMSEVLAQFLIFGGIAAYVHSLKDHKRLFYFLSGTAFGLAFLVRIDAVFVYVPFGLWFLGLIAFRRWTRDHFYLFGPLALLALQNATLYAVFSHDYLIETINSLERAYGRFLYYLAGLALASTLAVGYLWIRPSAGRRLAGWAANLSFGSTIILPVLVALISAYAYFVRPADAPPVAVYHALMEQEIVYDDGANLVKLGWYLSPLGIALGIAGMGWTLARRFGQRTWLLLAMASTYGLIFMHNAYVTPHHLFWVRRYLMVFIPALFIFAAALLLQWGKHRWSGRIYSIPRLAGSIALLVGIGIVMPRAIAAPQYQEGAQQLKTLSRMMTADSVAIFEPSEPAKWLALPLALLNGQSTPILATEKPDMASVDEALRQWWASGKEIYYVSHAGALTIGDDRLSFDPVGRARFDFRHLEMTFGKLPEEHQRVTFDADVYRISPRSGAKPLPAYPFELRLGDMDYGYIGDGFFRPEGSPPLTYRYTNGSAELRLPWNPSSGAQEVVLTVTASAVRPSSAPPALTSVYLEGSKVGEFSLPSAQESEENPYVEREVRIAIDEIDSVGKQARFVSIRLESAPWKPVEYGLGDTRSLGIAIRRIALRDE